MGQIDIGFAGDKIRLSQFTEKNIFFFRRPAKKKSSICDCVSFSFFCFSFLRSFKLHHGAGTHWVLLRMKFFRSNRARGGRRGATVDSSSERRKSPDKFKCLKVDIFTHNKRHIDTRSDWKVTSIKMTFCFEYIYFFNQYQSLSYGKFPSQNRRELLLLWILIGMWLIWGRLVKLFFLLHRITQFSYMIFRSVFFRQIIVPFFSHINIGCSIHSRI